MEAAITLFARRIESLPHGTFLKDVILIPRNILYYFKSFWNQFSANVQQQQDHTWPRVFTDCALGKGNVPFNHGWTPESTVYTVWNINNLHWVTLAISLPDWCISVYDSKVDAGCNGSQFMEELEHIAKMIPLALATLSAFVGYPQVSERMKVTRMGHDVVPMSYTQNCGVYAIKHLEHLITGTPLTKIVDEHISYFRLRLAVDIFHQKIEEEDDDEEEEGSTQSSPASCSANSDEGINSLDRPPINKVITGSTRCAMSEVALPEAEDKSDCAAKRALETGEGSVADPDPKKKKKKVVGPEDDVVDLGGDEINPRPEDQSDTAHIAATSIPSSMPSQPLYFNKEFLADTSTPGWRKNMCGALASVPPLPNLSKKAWDPGAKVAVGEGLTRRIAATSSIVKDVPPSTCLDVAVAEFGVASHAISTCLLSALEGIRKVNARDAQLNEELRVAKLAQAKLAAEKQVEMDWVTAELQAKVDEAKRIAEGADLKSKTLEAHLAKALSDLKAAKATRKKAEAALDISGQM